MFLSASEAGAVSATFPHASGDVPLTCGMGTLVPFFSPREWGCSFGWMEIPYAAMLFPTRVGMFRGLSAMPVAVFAFPHASGDVPPLLQLRHGKRSFSPREWGCSGGFSVLSQYAALFPTRVGMFRLAAVKLLRRLPFPHASGDVPPPSRRQTFLVCFSPREWGCSASPAGSRKAGFLFPTRVGMFRGQRHQIAHADPFPHASGDVPCRNSSKSSGLDFSPREWGCSV